MEGYRRELLALLNVFKIIVEEIKEMEKRIDFDEMEKDLRSDNEDKKSGKFEPMIIWNVN